MDSSLIHPNLKQMSNSSDEVLHKCPRKFEQYKLLPNNTIRGGDGDEHLDFGTIVGIGIQDVLITGSYDHACFTMFKAWNNILDDESGAKARKTFWHALYAVERFCSFNSTVLGNYELVYFNDQPATELGFTIDVGDGFNYRGKVDAVLRHRMRGEIVGLECKTTKNKIVHEAMFKHSGQALGYSLVLDTIVPLLGLPEISSMTVIYCIYKTFEYSWEKLEFSKSLTTRAKWIKNLLVDKQQIMQYAEDDYFPMRGEACYDFFRPCPYFGTCELSNNALLLGKEAEVKKDKEGDYPFKFNILEIIEAQLAR